MMGAIRRERVQIDGGAPIRCSVFFVSQSTDTKDGAQLQEQQISVSFSPHNKPTVGSTTRITYDGYDYLVRGVPEGIRALGRVDHWRITGVRITG